MYKVNGVFFLQCGSFGDKGRASSIYPNFPKNHKIIHSNVNLLNTRKLTSIRSKSLCTLPHSGLVLLGNMSQ